MKMNQQLKKKSRRPETKTEATHLRHGRRCSRHDGLTRGTEHCWRYYGSLMQRTTGSKPKHGGYLFDGENLAARRRRCWCGGCDDGDDESEH